MNLRAYSPLIIALVGPTTFIVCAEAWPDVLSMLEKALACMHVTVAVSVLAGLVRQRTHHPHRVSYHLVGFVIVPALLQAWALGLMLLSLPTSGLGRIGISAYVMGLPLMVWLMCKYRSPGFCSSSG